ncbi:MAG: serine/threonine protein kinase [Cyanobacteria bacterium P01_D01_bin.105]
MAALENLTPVVRLSRYQVVDVLGNGGFGKTFLVEDTQMPCNRRCVLKQLTPVCDHPQANEIVQERFRQDAAILETLGETHDQIPRVHATFSEGEQFYVVSEWIAGDTLTQKVQAAGPLPDRIVQDMIAGILNAIAHVHQSGLVHGNIQPDNIIFRTSDGKPVLINFGALKETMHACINSHSHSAQSGVLSTPGYMPAEQLSGRPVFASDIYAVGMTAIYALTGKTPQMFNIDPQTGGFQWRRYAPGISTEFANFLDCAIHMTAHSRFSVVQEMQSILHNLILNSSISPVQPIPKMRQSSETVISEHPVMGANSETPFPVQRSSRGEWKDAVIVGSMVGFSILFCGLVLIERFPNVMGGNAVTTAELDTVKSPDQLMAQPKSTSTESQSVTPVLPAGSPPVNNTPAGNTNAVIVGDANRKNIRSGPGTSYGIVHEATLGDRVVVRGSSSDLSGDTWYKIYVQKSGVDGWIASQLLRLD